MAYIKKLDDNRWEANYTTRLHKNASKENITTVYVVDVDRDMLIKEFGLPHSKVMSQSRYRNGNITDLNTEIKLSELLIKAPKNVITATKAVSVIIEKPLEERLQTIFEMAGETGTQGYLDNALAKNKLTEEEHAEGCDILTRLINL